MREGLKAAYFCRAHGNGVGFFLREDRALLQQFFDSYTPPSVAELTGKRGWLYSRIDRGGSTTPYALDQQEQMLRSFALKTGIAICGTTSEEATGRALDRAGLHALLSAAAGGRMDYVVTRSRDRICRSPDPRDMLRYEARLRAYGVRMVYLSEVA